ncbi:MAG: hypothetical protein ACRC6S_03775 [Shewanella sp.]
MASRLALRCAGIGITTGCEESKFDQGPLGKFADLLAEFLWRVDILHFSMGLGRASLAGASLQ